MRIRSSGVVVLALLVVLASACTDSDMGAEASDSTSASSSTSQRQTTSTLSQPVTTILSECVSGPGKAGIDERYEDLRHFYNTKDTEAMVRVIGDGPVLDPSLEPESDGEYSNVGEWLQAAEEADDFISIYGYGFYEPFALFASRRNPGLESVGIEELSVTLRFWVSQDCEKRVEVTDPISVPDACLFHETFRQASLPEECSGTFDPRAGHLSVWTGEEVLIFGGRSGTQDVPSLTTGLAYNPDTESWRDLKPSPVSVEFWPDSHAVWTGTEMLVIGRVSADNERSIVVLSYTPDTDSWTMSAPRPSEESASVGGFAWSGSEVIMAGGDLNAPGKHAWSYEPSTDTWRQLPDAPISPVEGIEGVWTGNEAIFVGGYPGAPAIAYTPSTGQWKTLASPPLSSLQWHSLAWTGVSVIVFGGHSGPGHPPGVLLYDPSSDSWKQSSGMPIPPRERMDGAWTGDELIIWGGYATYGSHPDEDGDHVAGDGAAYNPATDTWTVLPASPLSDRCDHTTTWTGTEVVVFGGIEPCGQPNIMAFGDAATYNPDAELWQTLRR